MSSSEYCRRAIFQIYNVREPKNNKNNNIPHYTKRGPGGTPSVFLIFYVFLKERFVSLFT